MQRDVLHASADFAEEALGTRFPRVPSIQMEKLAPGIEHLLSILHADVGAGSPAGPVLGESAILQVLHLLFPDDDRRDQLEYRSNSSPRLKQVRELIEANLSSRMSLMDLARAAEMSARHLTRAFRAGTGYTPHAYIVRRRLARARHLIEQGDLTLTEVAERVGFASHAHMTATFRNVLGVTPSNLGSKQT
jgi:transcriptional regulator GlxA family with amidase domain